jgi:hypothetical protein
VSPQLATFLLSIDVHIKSGGRGRLPAQGEHGKDDEKEAPMSYSRINASDNDGGDTPT